MNEIQAERIFDSITNHNDRQDSERWIMAYQASKVYGHYERYAVIEIANRTGVTKSAIKNWVNAYRCFRAICVVDCSVAKVYRRELTLTHFATMWEEMQKREFKAPQAILFFYLLYQSKINGDGYSVEFLQKIIKAHYNEDIGGNMNYHIKRMEKEIDALGAYTGLMPKRFKRWLDGWDRVKP